MTKPDRYELILNKNGQCFIRHDETNLQWFLFKAKCVSQWNLEKITYFFCRLFCFLVIRWQKSFQQIFNTQDKSLEQIIKFPDIKGDISTTINCSGVVQKNKKIKFFSCYKNQPGDEVYIYEIYKAFKKARFNPALLNRKKEEALVQFRIFF